MTRPLPSLAIPAAPAVRRICLAPGQTLRTWLPAGATLVSNGPGLTIAGAPQWISGHLLQPRQLINEGQTHWLEHGGWVQIDAARGGELLWLNPPPHWPARLARAMRQLSGRIRGATRSKGLSGVSKTG
ncbi:hypothetical protein [Herbaspirillum sp. alder98]|uniref:hypothetical protein n=1 Tax=Herbaspirillum sp. alder98 TaxID=2913096 RepID=UPI001CD8444B|nr:hypothetical protein [Herbaspirillum sp. alder98]MCA1327109.1 hypothetical protein [Herbaspirillum sp. alder98]